MYRRIICAIGLGSRESAEHAIRTSYSLLAPGGELTVAHVVERFPTTQDNPDSWAVSVIGEAEDKLTMLCKRLDIPAFVHVRSGPAARTLLTVAKERNADLIVVAAHRTDILDRIFGSTVDHIIRHAHSSVLIDRIENS
ncbi:universal stress protein [Rhizobium sp. P28RR-XV]|uniref:universal stress protein n=1 Tax=Rhizobium sp. P28RR-XV TaxID=2726737 RepID=UPI0014572EE8|nr:universal stress protein [Rhizobium sp. P28RR-XV]NLR89410.1 universal stress protein [Rhizobium sp. P28RR-XV]